MVGASAAVITVVHSAHTVERAPLVKVYGGHHDDPVKRTTNINEFIKLHFESLNHHRTNHAQSMTTRSIVCLGGLAHGSDMHTIYNGLGWCVIIQYDLQQFLTKYH